MTRKSTSAGGTAADGGAHHVAAPSSPTALGPTGLPSWGVYLHPSVYRLHVTGREVFLALEKNGALPDADVEPEREDPTAGQRAWAHSPAAAASLMLPPAPAIGAAVVPPSPNVSLLARKGSAGAGAGAGACSPGSLSHPPLSYAACGAHPQLVSFDYHVCAAVPVERPEDPAVGKALQREPLVVQLKSSRLNTLEEVVPGAAPHPPLTSAQLRGGPCLRGFCGVPALATTTPSAARERELAELAVALSAEGADAGVDASDAAAHHRRRRRRARAEQVQQTLYGSRRNAQLPLYYFQPAPHKGLLSGSVTGQRIGCGEGTGLDGSALLPGLNVALASLVEGEEAVFFVAAPHAFLYTGPEKKSIAAVAPINNRTGGGGLGGVAGPEQPGPLADGRPGRGGTVGGLAGPLLQPSLSGTRSRSHSHSSSTSSSTSSSAASLSSGDGHDTKKRGSHPRNVFDRLRLHYQQSRRESTATATVTAPTTTTTTTAAAAPTMSPTSGDGQRQRSVSLSATGTVLTPGAPQTALQLVKYSADDHVLCYHVRLRQRVPLASIVPVSPSLSMSFIAPRGAGGLVVVPRSRASMAAALHQLLTCTTDSARTSTAAAAAGATNPFVFFLQSHFAAGLRTNSTGCSTAARGGSPTSSRAHRLLSSGLAVAPQVSSESVARADGGGRASTSSTSSTLLALSPPPPPVLLGLGAVGDAESHVQLVLGDRATTLAAQTAAYVAVLYVLGAHSLAREVRSPTAAPSPSSLVKAEGQRFEAFTLAEAVAATAAVGEGPWHRPTVALRYLESDFLTFHQLSSTVSVGVEAHHALTQSFFPVPPPRPPLRSSAAAPSRHTVMVGSVASPCWLDMVCEATPRAGPTAAIVHLLSDAGDEVFVCRLLNDMRREAQQMLEDPGRVRPECARTAAAMDSLSALPVVSVASAPLLGSGGSSGNGTGGGSGTGTDPAGVGASLRSSTAPAPEHGCPPGRELAPMTDTTSPSPSNPLISSVALEPGPVAVATSPPAAAAAATVAAVGSTSVGGHYTRGDAAAYRRATAPSALQRRLESAYRVIFDPSASTPAAAEGGGGSTTVSPSGSPSAAVLSGPVLSVGHFFFANPQSSCAAVRRLLVESCGMMQYYATVRAARLPPGGAARAVAMGHCSSLALLVSESGTIADPLNAELRALLQPGVEAALAPGSHNSALPAGVGGCVIAVTAATQPGTVVADYFGRQHPRFTRRAAVGAQPSLLNPILLGPSWAEVTASLSSSPTAATTTTTTTAAGVLPGGTGAAGLPPLSVVAAAALMLPCPPMAPELRERHVLPRILLKALKRLYTAIFLLTFNVDETAARPALLRSLSDHRTPPSVAVPTDSTAAAGAVASQTVSPDPHHPYRRRRLSYLGECYTYVALLCAELEGMDGHALDAVAAALSYSPHEVPLWSLRAVLLTRRRQYAAAVADVEAARGLAMARATAVAGAETVEEAESAGEAVRVAREWVSLLTLQAAGVAQLMRDTGGGAGTTPTSFGGSSHNSAMGGMIGSGGGAGVSVTDVPVLGSALLAHNGAGSMLH